MLSGGISLNFTVFFGKLTKYIRIYENIEDAIELIGIDNEEFIVH